MKLDYFKDCVIGTELKLNLFLERNRGLMGELAANVVQDWINQKAIVLRFSVKAFCTGSEIILAILIDGEYIERKIEMLFPKEQHESTGIIY